MRLNRVRIVTFSGIDGAGKSTQIEASRNYLQSLGYRVVVLTFWDNIVALARFREQLSSKAFKGDQGIGSPENPIQRRDKNVSAWYITVFRLFLYLLDGLNLRLSVARFSPSDADFIIFDRYIYDEMANLPIRRPLIRGFIRLLLSLVPKPDVAFVLDADPEAATLRKPEYPLAFVRKNREAYLRLSGFIGGVTVIPPSSAEQMTKMIEQIISEKCLPPERSFARFRVQYPASPGTAKSTSS